MALDGLAALTWDVELVRVVGQEQIGEGIAAAGIACVDLAEVVA